MRRGGGWQGRWRCSRASKWRCRAGSTIICRCREFERPRAPPRLPVGARPGKMSSPKNNIAAPSRRALIGGATALALAGPATRGQAAAASFRDPLMKLFVVSDLMRQKRIDLGTSEAFYRRILGRPHDAKVDGYRAHPKALEYFAQL